MRSLVECLIDWLAGQRSELIAHSLLQALAQETLKRADSADPAQREFDAQELAAAASRAESADFDAAKRWVERCRLDAFVEARTDDREAFFAARGHKQCLRPAKRSPAGKHRAQWFLQTYELQTSEAQSDSPSAEITDESVAPWSVIYEQTPPGMVKSAWWTRPLIGTGSLVVKSPRGLLWGAYVLLLALPVVAASLVVLGLLYVQRPVQTGDIALLLILAAFGYFTWYCEIRPMTWLVEDRLIPAGDAWVALHEKAAQLELVNGPDGRRMLQLVRYTAVCPLCAGALELRYSMGRNRRRLVGCCNEAPQDHVFSFDRIRRTGSRIQCHAGDTV